ncbi:hypothetical protein PR003_g5826 [Phytophthora rubi]|uniref:Uncharacterized protein n=1 Tax=Phytophthora rubi TaxID=129364 RepID=A0A6A4FP32_9STRA|nr:hypothetical protein PR003_g5826 [Phytophthora rubi]
MLEMLLSSEPSRVLLQSMSDPSAGDYSKVTLKTGEVHNREIEHDGERVDEDFVMILGRDGATIKSKKIRTMDKLQAVSGYKNRSKVGMLDLITQMKLKTALFQNKKLARSDPPPQATSVPLQTAQYCLSAAFAACLYRLGDNRTRAELNNGVSLQQRFWEDVYRAFVSSSET